MEITPHIHKAHFTFLSHLTYITSFQRQRVQQLGMQALIPGCMALRLDEQLLSCVTLGKGLNLLVSSSVTRS